MRRLTSRFDAHETFNKPIPEFQKCVKRLAEMENKVDDGLLVELPLPVDTPVYITEWVAGDLFVIHKGSIDSYTYDGSLIANISWVYNGDYHEMNISFNGLDNYNVFLTEKEAEQRLKKLKEGRLANET